LVILDNIPELCAVQVFIDWTTKYPLRDEVGLAIPTIQEPVSVFTFKDAFTILYS